jgi:hypothetical protein
MADNPTVDNGTGTDYTVAADDVTVTGMAAGLVQYVKLVDGTANGTEPIVGTTANGLDVDVTRVIPGTTATALGKAEDAAHTDGDTGVLLLGVRNYAGASADGEYSALCVDSSGVLCVMVRPQAPFESVATSGSLTIATTAYTAGDQMGAQFTMANCARSSGGGGYLRGITLVSAADNIGPVTVFIFEASATAASDNAAFAISDADALKLIDQVSLNASDIGNNRFARSGFIEIPYTCVGSTSLFAMLRTDSGHTFFGAATDLELRFWCDRA